MATKKYRLNRKNSDGSYDVIHYETSSNIVVRPDGSSVEESLSNNNLPSGIIAMWSGAANAIPSGWLLCNGSNGTPDLRNRFIVGAGSSYSVGNTGGSDSVTLTSAQMPSHTHGHSLSAASAGNHAHSHNFSISLNNLSCSSAGQHSHTINAAMLDSESGMVNGWPGVAGWRELTTSIAGSHTHVISGTGTLIGSIASNGAHTHSLSGAISSSGSGGSHENRPPYYALFFIMKK